MILQTGGAMENQDDKMTELDTLRKAFDAHNDIILRAQVEIEMLKAENATLRQNLSEALARIRLESWTASAI